MFDLGYDENSFRIIDLRIRLWVLVRKREESSLKLESCLKPEFEGMILPFFLTEERKSPKRFNNNGKKVILTFDCIILYIFSKESMTKSLLWYFEQH